VPLTRTHALGAKSPFQEGHEAPVVGQCGSREIFRQERQQSRQVAAADVAIGCDRLEIARSPDPRPAPGLAVIVVRHSTMTSPGAGDWGQS
jgi:hypothetical protein